MSESKDGCRTAATITLTAPTGYEFVLDHFGRARFEYPKKGALFLSDTGGVLDCCPMYPKQCMAEKRFLLQKKVTVVPAAQQYPKCIKVATVAAIYGGDVIVPEGWEYVDFRPAALGESFLDSARPSDVIEKACPTQLPRIIVRKSA